jgi:hypothetical protein
MMSAITSYCVTAPPPLPKLSIVWLVESNVQILYFHLLIINREFYPGAYQSLLVIFHVFQLSKFKITVVNETVCDTRKKNFNRFKEICGSSHSAWCRSAEFKNRTARAKVRVLSREHEVKYGECTCVISLLLELAADSDKMWVWMRTGLACTNLHTEPQLGHFEEFSHSLVIRMSENRCSHRKDGCIK